jgi:membrane protein DedA with SNARE-associated domain
VSLRFLGVLVARGGHVLRRRVPGRLLGVVLGDTGRLGARPSIGLQPTGWITRFTGRKRIEWIERFYARYGAGAIVFCRQIPGLRFPGFFFAARRTCRSSASSPSTARPR